MRIIPVSLLLALAGVLYLQWEMAPIQAPQIRSPGVPDESSSDSGAIVAFEMPLLPKDEFAVIERRPLFVEGRRPFEMEPEAAPTLEQGELSDLDFSAVAITPKGRMAWVRDRKTGVTERINVGSAIRGWTVKSIEPDFLLVETDGKEARIALLEFSSAAAAPAVSAPPVPQRPVLPQRLLPRGPQR